MKLVHERQLPRPIEPRRRGSHSGLAPPRRTAREPLRHPQPFLRKPVRPLDPRLRRVSPPVPLQVVAGAADNACEERLDRAGRDEGIALGLEHPFAALLQRGERDPTHDDHDNGGGQPPEDPPYPGEVGGECAGAWASWRLRSAGQILRAGDTAGRYCGLSHEASSRTGAGLGLAARQEPLKSSIAVVI